MSGYCPTHGPFSATSGQCPGCETTSFFAADGNYTIAYEQPHPDDPMLNAQRWKAERDELQARVDAALKALGLEGASNWERVQAAGLILSADKVEWEPVPGVEQAEPEDER